MFDLINVFCVYTLKGKHELDAIKKGMLLYNSTCKLKLETNINKNLLIQYKHSSESLFANNYMENIDNVIGVVYNNILKSDIIHITSNIVILPLKILIKGRIILKVNKNIFFSKINISKYDYNCYKLYVNKEGYFEVYRTSECIYSIGIIHSIKESIYDKELYLVDLYFQKKCLM
jgi:hypothetical protein